MDVQYDRKKLLALVTTIMLCGVSVLYADMDKENVPTETTVQGSASEVPGRRSIRGSDTSIAEEEIRNPFTMRHETATEDSQVAAVDQTKVVPASIPARKDKQPRPKVSERVAPPVSKDQMPERSWEPELCGIMQGSDGQVAILRFGEKTAVLAMGEAFQDWALVHMEAGSVILRRGWQEKCLYLRSY